MSGKETKYRYFVEVEDKEHMLYYKEIAIAYGIFTVNGTPHTRLVGAIIDKYKKEKDIKEKYYFKTRFGLSEVIPYRVYHNAINEFNVMTDGRREAVIENIKYNFNRYKI